ncbi:MAG: NAD(+) synthase [Desulfobacterales bacterium]|nr:NAD(+) synthase [Desulfobacterales bacterium]
MMVPIRLPSMDCETVCREIGDFVISTVEEVGATGCVIGLSGGVDSSTTAALIQRAFTGRADRQRPRFELAGYIVPSRVNVGKDAQDARTVAEMLGIRCEVCNIESIVEAFRATNPEAFENDYDRGNLISRVRANVLSTKAATENKVIAGTGNKDEDFGIGYYTLFGDGAVHISPISGLSKRLVRQMAAFLRLPDHIVHRVPAAGLEPEQSDFKDLGYRYDLVEMVSEGFDQGLTKQEMAEHEQVIELAVRDMERYRSAFGRTQFSTVAEMISDIESRHRGAERKMRIVHPPGPKITLIYK